MVMKAVRRRLRRDSSGVILPAETSAERLYRKLFVAGTPEEKAAQYNLQQAKLAIGSGGLWGAEPGGGRRRRAGDQR